MSFVIALAISQTQTDGGVPSRLTHPPLATARPIAPEADLLVHADAGYPGLTIEPALQKQLTDILRLYQTPWAAVVAVESATGRVLAMAEHSEVDPGLRGLCTQALYPAASIFKIVTAAALLEAGVSPTENTCFHGGKRKLTPKLLEDSEKDQRCDTMAGAMANSRNVIFGKLAQSRLDAPTLGAMAKAFRFNAPLPFPVPTGVSQAAIPDDGFGLALAGAGFGDVYLSPLHGALLAAAVANGGLWRDAILHASAVPKAPERMLSAPTASKLQAMLVETVKSGTARRIFHERHFTLDDAAGKTGSLADKTPFRDYSWFVGYAPASNPKVAVAAVVVNDPYWRIRATWLGREAMRLALTPPARPAPVPRSAETATAPPVPEAATR